MKLHIQYSFLALIVCVLLLCLLSYLSFLHPVKRSKPVETIKTDDIKHLLHQASVVLLKNASKVGDKHAGGDVQGFKSIAPAPVIDVGTKNSNYESDDDEDDAASSSSSLSFSWDPYDNDTIDQSQDESDVSENGTAATDESDADGEIQVDNILMKLKSNHDYFSDVATDTSKLPSTRITNKEKILTMSKPSLDDYKHNDNNDIAGHIIPFSPTSIDKKTRSSRFNANVKSEISEQKLRTLGSDLLTRAKHYNSNPLSAKSKLQSSFNASLHDIATAAKDISKWTRQQNKHNHCTPKKNIVFLKTHKCATSTVQNIFFRYGDKHQLNFVLPKSTRDHRFSMKEPFDRQQVYRPMGGRNPGYFNIFTNHAIFNQREIEAIMPDDSIYISILRDPVTMFESIYTYMRLDLRFSPDKGTHLVSMEEFLAKAPQYYENWDKVYSGQFSRNPMLYDLGLHPADMDDETTINNLISIIDKRFDLIMIADYFEESLIMLKHLLCLEIEEIAYLTTNARSEDSVRDIDDSLSKKIKAWNWGDVLLFNHFNRTFHERLKLFDQDQMRREITELRKFNTHLQDRCVADVAVDMTSVWHPEGIKIEGFKLKSDQQDENGLCKKVTRAEKVYNNLLKLRQS